MSNGDTWSTEPGLSLTDTLNQLTSLPPYKRSEDKRGHDAFLGGRVPKDVARLVTKIKEAGHYETNSDAVRDAISLGIKILELRYKADPDWKPRIQLMDQADRVAWEARIYDEEQKFVENISKLYRNGDEAQAAEDLEERLALLSSGKESSKRRRVLRERLGSAHLPGLEKRMQQ